MHSAEDHLTQDALDADAHAHGAVPDNAAPDMDDEGANELAQAHSQMAYLAAEFENYKRQTSRRIEEATSRAKRGVLEDILPALDNFLLAQKYAGSAQSAEQIKTGLDYVAQQMETALEQAGLEPIRAQGAAFDPALHEAIEEVSVPGATPGTVVEETRRGFRFGGQVLRTSVVKVAK